MPGDLTPLNPPLANDQEPGQENKTSRSRITSGEDLVSFQSASAGSLGCDTSYYISIIRKTMTRQVSREGYLYISSMTPFVLLGELGLSLEIVLVALKKEGKGIIFIF